MKVPVIVDAELAARITLDPQTKDLPIEQCLLALIDRGLKVAEDARSPDVFAAKCLEHVKKFEVGRVFGLIQAVPPGESFNGSKWLTTMSKLLVEKGVVRVLPEEERVMIPMGNGRNECKATYERIQEA